MELSKMTLQEVNKQISELQCKRRELEKQYIENFKKDARQHVGRCFKIDDKYYIKVIGIPQERHTMTGIEFNEYQFPAIKLVDDIIPFERTDLPSAAVGIGMDPLHTYQEILKEEFEEEFQKRIDRFSKNVLKL